MMGRIFRLLARRAGRGRGAWDAPQEPSPDTPSVDWFGELVLADRHGPTDAETLSRLL